MSEHAPEPLPSRRDFLRAAGATIAAASLAAAGLDLTAAEARAGDPAPPLAPPTPTAAPAKAPLPTRPLGKTGERVSILGLGGWHVGIREEALGVALVRRAVDEGITFLDNAADYHEGRSEERMGRALAEGKLRDRVFLMTKCCDHARTRDGSRKALEESLRRLRTDRLDLYQLHQIAEDDDPARIFAKGGAIEALLEAKAQGKTRFIGFTGHTDPALMLEMLSHDVPWDTVQMPLNPVDPHVKSFERLVLPKLVERGIGVIAMKSLASGSLAKSGLVTAAECRRYALSLPVATLVAGIDSDEVLAQDLAVARAFTPLDEAARKALSEKVKPLAGKRDVEWYKRA